MLLRKFYLTVAASDESAALFLREKSILQVQDSCEKCDGLMRLANKKSGAHAQRIERSWLESKFCIMKKKCGFPIHHFQGRLDEYCWRFSKGTDADLFLCILEIKYVKNN